MPYPDSRYAVVVFSNRQPSDCPIPPIPSLPPTDVCTHFCGVEIGVREVGPPRSDFDLERRLRSDVATSSGYKSCVHVKDSFPRPCMDVEICEYVPAVWGDWRAAMIDDRRPGPPE